MKKLSSLKITLYVLFVVSLSALFTWFFGPFWMERGDRGFLDYLFLATIIIHLMWGASFFKRSRLQIISSLFRTPEILFLFTLILFLFSYIWAMNANMDYIQRFAANSGNIHLAPDSFIQRLNAVIKFFPYLLMDGFIIVYFRINRKNLFISAFRPIGLKIFSFWAFPLALLSAALYTFSFPSFISLSGIPLLGYVCLVPLLLILKHQKFGRGLFYGITFGVIQSMLTNYWLGTFSLVSLQFSTIYHLLIYTVFTIFLIWIIKKTGPYRPYTSAAVWVLFDYLRSSGFLGYPWALAGASQYSFLPLIQIASVTGIWGVSFVVVWANAALAEVIETRNYLPFTTWAVAFLVLIIGGEARIIHESTKTPEKTVKIALIQQNTDPRKDDYTRELAILKELTNKTLPEKPDLIAWSETAFVPNIRKWSKPENRDTSLGLLVKDFLAYQKSINTFLVTGNDDYLEETDPDGKIQRKDFNASIFFSDNGERLATYHKMHLVPFTEYFPYKKQFPWFYQLLLDFDVYLWEPGTERVIFRHPLFSFFTPICFEDGFPNDIRRFVLSGADIILNLSNDFWSLTKIEAKQHFINSVFRAVENRRPLLRSTASGVTCSIDTTGKPGNSLPYYQAGYIVESVPLTRAGTTIYTRLGDWFPVILLSFLLFSLFMEKYSRKNRPGSI